MNKITQVASLFHDEWRKPRLIKGAHGHSTAFYEPRPKDDGNGGTVDIANTAYQDLPEKWQNENRNAAEVLVQLLDMESLAAQVHDVWSGRNSWSTLAKIPYAALPEEEKEKDRAQVRIAMKVLME